MIIDTDDPSIIEYLRKRQEAEEAMLKDDWPSERAVVQCHALPAWNRTEVLEGDALPKVLLDEQAEYVRHNGIIDVTICKYTSTEQKIKIKEQDAVNYFSQGMHVGGGPALPVLLPPGRKDPSVSGQLKLAIDVALAVPHMLATDKVVVVGSASMEGVTGASYYLMAGRVAQVDLWDPIGPEKQEVIEGTVFVHHRAQWPESQPIIADVVFCDAYANDTAIVFPVSARVYSIKDVGPGVEHKIKCYLPNAWRYGQLSDTVEVRWVSHPRIAGRYRRRLGDCAACRELDYKNTGYVFSDYQMSVWRDQHAYKYSGCVLSQHDRPPSQVYASTITWRTHAYSLTARPAGPTESLHMIQLDEEIPRQYLTGYGFYSMRGEAWKFVEYENERPDDLSWRDFQLQHVFELENRAIVLKVIPYVRASGAVRRARIKGNSGGGKDGNGLEDGNSKDGEIWCGILVVDTFVYLLTAREASSDVKSHLGYCYGPLVSPRSIGVWSLSRFGNIVAKGNTGAMLSARCVLARKTGRYETCGSYSFLDE